MSHGPRAPGTVHIFSPPPSSHPWNGHTRWLDRSTEPPPRGGGPVPSPQPRGAQPLETMNGPAVPPPFDLAMIRPGLAGRAAALRSRPVQSPMRGGAAATTWALAPGMAAPADPSALTRYSWMIALSL